ncbi:MAG: NAD(+) synthase [Pseudomonadota bacterium]
MDFSRLGYLRVAAAATAVDLANPQANAQHVLERARALAQQDVAIGLFPELALSGYSAEDLFFSEQLLRDVREALANLITANPLPMLVVGLPWRLPDGRLLNCAAIISEQRLLGMIPKSVHPNYAEFYDLRWFAPGADVDAPLVDDTLGSCRISIRQLFALQGHLIGVEICEDLWAPRAPSTEAALAGASILLNLSASNELIGKAEYRANLVTMSSAKNICAYIYASAGPSESTKDVVYGGHCLAAENGQMLGSSERYEFDGHTLVVDVDTQRLQHDRAHNATFSHSPRPERYEVITSPARVPALPDLVRHYPRQPFVPDDEHEIEARAQNILAIQTTGLARRMRAARSEHLVIGLSGGLDSTLAFLVSLDAVSKLGMSPSSIHALTLPGPGTSDLTLNNARRLAGSTGATLHEIDISASVRQHLADLKHAGEHDVVFENAQARERTQILFNYANKVGGIVVGTGDLSELALGWCTYNADHMASYNVNASVPKTLIKYLVRWYGVHRTTENDPLDAVLDEVLATPISPELLPPEEGEIMQRTESIVGPYELHDFFLFHFLRNGAAPEKIYHLCVRAFDEHYDAATIKHWLHMFFVRFFSAQFKRTTLPPGPKVGSVSLSPRGDWRMPDEASVEQFVAAIDKL